MIENLDIQSVAGLVNGGLTTLAVAMGSKPAAVFIDKISRMVGWYLEPAKIVRNARAEAVAAVIKAEADQEVKELSERAAARILYEETKHQRNIEAVVLGAILGITDDAKPESLDDDWLDNFFDKCRRISNADMQRLWAQILSSETNKPGSFSPRTVNLVSTLTKEDALMFKSLCTYNWTSNDEIITSIITQEILNEEGYGQHHKKTDIEAIWHLESIGLLSLEAGTELLWSNSDGEEAFFSYHGQRFDLSHDTPEGRDTSKIKELPIGHVRLSQTGAELAQICMPEPDWLYMKDIVDSWRAQGFLAINPSRPS